MPTRFWPRRSAARLTAAWLSAVLFWASGIGVTAQAALLHDNGGCCIDDAVFSDQGRGIWQADDVTLAAADTLGGIRFWGVYANSSGGFFTSSLPDGDAFTLRVFADASGEPGALAGESGLTGMRIDTGMNLGPTSLRWYRYDMALDTPITLDAGAYWISVVNDTTADQDDDWAWGLTDDEPLHAFSIDDGAEWAGSDIGNLAFALFDADGVTALTLTNAVEGDGGQAAAAAEVGDRLVYRLEIGNTSGAPAEGLVIEHALPDGVAFVSAVSTPSITPTVFADALRWDVGTLPGGAPDNVFAADVTVDVSAAAGGRSVASAVSVRAVDAPFFPGAAATATFEGVNPEAVTIEKAASRSGEQTGSATVGDRLSYAITVTNEGDAPRDASVTDLLPDGLEYVGDSGGYDPGTGTWAVGALPEAAAAPDNTRTLTITADVLPAADGELLVNKATITSLDGEGTNIFDTAPISVFGTDLAVSFSGTRDAAGTTITRIGGGTRVFFQFQLTNNGPDEMTAPARITLTEVYSPNFGYDGFQNVFVFDTPDFSGEPQQQNADCMQAGRIRTCPLQRPGSTQALAAGETISFEVSVFAAPVIVPDVEMTLELLVASDSVDPSTGNNAAAPVIGVDEIEQALGGGEDGSRCFIATAAYGSYLAPEVAALRAFRDKHLLTHRWGRAFVAAYYRYSPAAAEVIAASRPLRAVTRWLLTPAVYAVKHPLAAGVLLCLAAAGLLRIRRRRTQAAAC